MSTNPDPHRRARRAALKSLVAGGLGAAAWPLSAQAKFPSRPITLVVPFGAGGVADIVARAVGEQMASTLGVPVVIDNKPSAGSIVASQAVATAKPDGHTLLLMSNGNAVSVGLFRKLPYDTEKAFAPISTLGHFDIGLFVAADSRFATLRDLIAYAKAHPGQLNVATITPGSTQHLAARWFEMVAGIDVLTVPYKGSPAVLQALRAGEADLAFEIVAPMVGQVAAGVVRALAVSSSRRNPALPEVPTVQQAGLAGYDVSSWNALAAPAGTPSEVIDRLGRAAHEALAVPAVRDRLSQMGMRVQASTPAELQSLLGREIRRWGDVIRRAGIVPE